MNEELPQDVKKELAKKLISSMNLDELINHLGEDKPEDANTPTSEHQLTEDEYIRVENIMLHEQIEAMRKELIRREIAAKKNALQAYFIHKYAVDENTHKIQLDGTKRTLSIIPK